MRMKAYARTKTPNGPGEAAHLPDRLRPVEVEAEALAVAHDRGHGQVRLERLADRDRAAARAPAAVRLRERLVQVVVDDVEAHVAGPRDPADGVEVRAVVVHERADTVEDPRDLLDALVEEPERRRVREHEPRGRLVDLRAEVLDVEVPARVGLDVDEVEAGHGHTRRIRPVGGVRDDDASTLLDLAALGEVRAHQHQPGELALAAGSRLQRDGGQAGDLGEDLLQAPHQLERPLRPVLLLERVHVAEAGQRDDALVHARVVLHRAGAERVEARVDPEVAGRQLGEVADELRLRELGEPRRLGTAELGRELGDREPRARHDPGAAPRPRLLVDQLHAATSVRTSTSRSISAVVRRSVVATRSTSSIPS